MEALSDELAPEDMVVPGSSGACSEVTMQAIRVRRGVRILNSQGLGSMGFGIPAAIGACLASGGRRTVCIEGDGGFQMNSQELETVMRLKLPIKCFVLNNGGYGSIRATQKSYFNSRLVGSDESSGLTLPAVWGSGRRLRHSSFDDRQPSSTVQSRETSPGNAGPVMVDVKISPDQYTAPELSPVRGRRAR